MPIRRSRGSRKKQTQNTGGAPPTRKTRAHSDTHSPKYPRPNGTKTHIPNTNIPIQWNDYAPESQQRAWMTPEEFLRLVPPPSLKNNDLTFFDSSIKGIDQSIRNGEPIWSLRLDVNPTTKQVLSHEGRHRSAWAYKHNIPYLPVVIWHHTGKYLVTKKRNIPVTQLKPQHTMGVKYFTNSQGEVYYIDRSAWDVLQGNTKIKWDTRELKRHQREERTAFEHELRRSQREVEETKWRKQDPERRRKLLMLKLKMKET